MTTNPPVEPPYISSQTPQPVRVVHTHADGSKEHKVLVLGTGGTIASEPTSEGYKPISELWARNVFFKRIRQHPQLSDAPPASFNSEVVSTPVGKNLRYPALRTPPLDEHDNTVVYEILDLENHMDSSEMQPGDWNKIAELIHENWDAYEGFVVLSGTDTLAYTSSILTFLFAGAGKPIVVTGAQIPLREPRSDGWYNLLESLLVAGTLPFAGVSVVFYHQALQGCRATKSSPNLLKAFETPSVPAWINLNVKVTALPDLQPRSDAPPPPLVTLESFPTVLSCAIYPGITGSVLAAQIHSMPTCKAVIVSAFGSGNLPIKEETGVLQALEAAVKREILVVVISTCHVPNIYPLYALGVRLLSVGVLPGFDMTHEAAFAKSIWLVSRKDLSFKERQELWQTPIAGEMTI
ncbi:hypothetical protein VHUM_02341 [Vanrija humicola]|uniref:asparaginase n=1 Tax=Vanrija humicola TaxID=5417 RepID=A0A7D8Z095_VANHU|nr:hypothetical protein VHUM_02341 [Vanrija humicola]